MNYVDKFRVVDALIAVLIFAITWSIYRAHRDPQYREFNFFDLIMENGRISRLACVFIGTWLVHSWIMIRLTIDGKMSDGYFTSYGAIWAAPIIAKMFSGPSSSTTVLTSSTTEVTQEKKL